MWIVKKADDSGLSLSLSWLALIPTQKKIKCILGLLACINDKSGRTTTGRNEAGIYVLIFSLYLKLHYLCIYVYTYYSHFPINPYAYKNMLVIIIIHVFHTATTHCNRVTHKNYIHHITSHHHPGLLVGLTTLV